MELEYYCEFLRVWVSYIKTDSSRQQHQCVEIIPHLYLGDMTGPDFNVDCVISIGATCRKHSGKAAIYMYIDLDDSVVADCTPHIDTVLDTIHECRLANKTTYIHCAMGYSRSPTFVAFYLMKYCDMNHWTALKFIKEKIDIGPNVGFLKQLFMHDQRTGLNESYESIYSTFNVDQEHLHEIIHVLSKK